MATAELVRTAPAAPALVLSPTQAGSAAAPAPRALPDALPTGTRAAARLAYLDSLKVALTALVIAHHAGQAYGPTGGRWPIFDPARAAILGPFFAVNAAFFMGLFFFLSAYFVPASFDCKGAAAFLRDRFVRLGVPLACFALVVFAPLSYVDYAAQGGTRGFLPYVAQVYLRQWRVDVGHLWFLAHLLAYAVLYSACRLVTRVVFGRRAVSRNVRAQRPPGHVTILAFTLALASVTFAVRLVYPIDRWVNLFGFLPAEVAHLPQYAALFAAGVVASRREWVRTLPAAIGLTWLAIGGRPLRCATLISPRGTCSGRTSCLRWPAVGSAQGPCFGASGSRSSALACAWGWSCCSGSGSTDQAGWPAPRRPTRSAPT